MPLGQREDLLGIHVVPQHVLTGTLLYPFCLRSASGTFVFRDLTPQLYCHTSPKSIGFAAIKRGTLLGLVCRILKASLHFYDDEGGKRLSRAIKARITIDEQANRSNSCSSKDRAEVAKRHQVTIECGRYCQKSRSYRIALRAAYECKWRRQPVDRQRSRAPAALGRCVVKSVIPTTYGTRQDLVLLCTSIPPAVMTKTPSFV